MNKIKEFFLKLFGKEQKKLDKAKEEVIQKVEKNESENNLDSLKSKYINKEEEENRKLFILFRKKQIKEEDLTEAQKQQISEMYDKEIAKVEKETEHYKNKILKYKKILDLKKS